MTAKLNLRSAFGRIMRRHPHLLELCISADNWLRGSRVSQRGERNRLLLLGVRMRRTRIRVEGADNVLEILPGTRLFDSHITIRGSGHRVKIGSNCVFDQLVLNVWSRDTEVVVGDRTESAPVRMEVGEPDVSLHIGDDGMISRGVEILCTDSHSLMDAASGRRINPARSVVIGEHVWLGAHSTILKGASIGSHSVIGLRSTVSSKLPAGVIAVGSPASAIRSGVTWHRELL